MSRVDYYDAAGKVTQQSVVLQAAALRARSSLTATWNKLLVVMVGMPARGKSFIAHKLMSFLSWSGHVTRVFNVGQHRRGKTGEAGRSKNSEANFFDTSNSEASATRERLALEVLHLAFQWFEEGGEIAIFDATNSTRARRARIAAEVPAGVEVVFVESVCNDCDVIEANMKVKVAASPDFRGMSEADALADLRQRIANYEAVYETVEDEEGRYVKLYDFSSKVAAHLCFGRLSKTVVPYLMAVHSDDRPIYLTALAPTSRELEYSSNGEAADEPNAKLGAKLREWWWGKERTACSLSTSDRHSRLQILASTLQLAVDVAELIRAGGPDLVTVVHTSNLNPLFLGDRQRRAIIEDDTVLSRRSFSERLDGGESYADLVARLESTILDVEASVDPVLIVTHATPARALRAYFLGLNVADCLAANDASPQTSALANKDAAILEIRAKMSGAWEETIHVL